MDLETVNSDCARVSLEKPGTLGRQARVPNPIFLTNQYCKEFKIIEFVGCNKKVLEIGCYNGHMSLYFVANRCTVTGIEVDRALAVQAQRYCNRVIIGDIEDESTIAHITERFDVIVMADLLEHLRDPWVTLERMKRLLTPGGYIIIAIPNFAFVTMRLRLLLGSFEYSQTGGLLDITHLRFFTLKTMRNLIARGGYRIISFYSAPWLIRGERVSKIPLLGPSMVIWNGILPALFARVMPSLLGVSFVAKVGLPDTD